MTTTQHTSKPSAPGTEHALYRFYSDTGQLLYVGITSNPGNRFPQHQADKHWWHEVAGISLETHNTREDALAAEARAIAVENPKYNKVRPTPGKRHRKEAARQIGGAFAWLCDECGRPIADRSGYLHINLSLVWGVQQSWEELTARVRHREQQWLPDRGMVTWTGADLLQAPDRVRWQVHHSECADPDDDDHYYWIDVETARTHAQLLTWTSHLMGKRWLKDTNWQDLIKAAAEAK